MSVNVHQEILKYSIPAIKNDETNFNWHGSLFTIHTDKGLSIFTLGKDFRSISKEINYINYVVENPKTSATSELIPKCFVSLLNRNIDYTQLVVDPVLWPHNPQLVAEASRIISFCWAPVECIFQYEYILAVLSSTGNVELLAFDSERNGWTTKINVTKQFIVDNPTTVQYPKNVKELKQVIDVYASSAICWQPEMISENSCYFVTAQKNGSLLFWLITSNNVTISIDFIFSQTIDCTEVINVIWIPKSNDNFFLICADDNGKVYNFEFHFETNCIIKHLNTVVLWEHQDKMIASNFAYMRRNDSIILLFSKNRHLAIQELNKNGVVLHAFIKNINDYKITSIARDESAFFTGTVNCKTYTITITDNFNVNVTPIQLIKKEMCNGTHELHSIAVCHNYTFLGLALMDIKLRFRKESNYLEVLVMNHKTPANIITNLINNKDNKLTNKWASIEYLRQKTFKTKTMPDINFLKLYSDADKNPYKLKLYFIFLTWYHGLKAVFASIPFELPEISIEKVKRKILLLHALSVIMKTSSKFPNINEFEQEVFGQSKKYIKHYCKQFKDSIENYIPVQKFELITECPGYTCQSCNKEIKGFSCEENHFNLFCTQTFTLIESDDYLSCKNCNVVARLELLPTMPLCVFCDVQLRES